MMTTMAAPVTYATAAAPTYTTMAAPQYTMAPVVTQSPSYVAQPVQYIQQPAVQVAAGPPADLCAGIPTPQVIEAQRVNFAKALDKQYADGNKTIEEEKKLKMQMLVEQAKQQKAQQRLQVESQTQAQNLLLDQQMNSQLMMLQEAAMQQKSVLEQQAAALTLEYQQKKAEEEMLQKQFEIQKQYYDAENVLAAQFQKVAQEEAVAMNNILTEERKLGMIY